MNLYKGFYPPAGGFFMPTGVYKHKKGYKRPPITDEWRKHLSDSHAGQKAWNKGLKGYLSGDKHWKWQAENPSYHAVHEWINDVLGKPKRCEFCGTITAKRYEWANKSREYKRDVKDWIRLCKSCHCKFDNTLEKSWITRKARIDL